MNVVSCSCFILAMGYLVEWRSLTFRHCCYRMNTDLWITHIMDHQVSLVLSSRFVPDLNTHALQIPPNPIFAPVPVNIHISRTVPSILIPTFRPSRTNLTGRRRPMWYGLISRLVSGWFGFGLCFGAAFGRVYFFFGHAYEGRWEEACWHPQR